MMKALVVTPISDEKKPLFSFDGLEMIFKNRNKITDDDMQDIEIVLGNLPLNQLQKAPHLKWVQLDSAGVQDLYKLPDTIQLTNASGAYGQAISEHMLASVLAMMKNLYPYYNQQVEHCWHNLGSVQLLSECKVLCIGLGDIGSSFAQKIHCLGAEVYGIRRTIHDKPEYLAALGTMEDIDRYLPLADIVALSLPETEQTKHLFDYERLHLMKKNSLLLNVGRGSAIETEALIKTMQEEYLAGVHLDVTEWEPLPKNSALWKIKNVYITPHISGRFNAQVTYDKVLQIFITNINHYLNQEPLEHIVDKKLGY